MRPLLLITSRLRSAARGIALACAFAFIVLQQVANQRASHLNYVFGILAGLCVIFAGLSLAAQRSAEIYHGDELLDNLPPWLQKLIPAYHIRKLFSSRQTYARFNFIAAGAISILMGIAFAFWSFSR